MLLEDLLSIDYNSFITNLVFAAIIVIIGFLLGTAINFLLKKLAKKAELDRGRGYNFIRLGITVITWSIYLLFLNFALIQLNIPTLTNWLSSILLIIPALTGALILLVVGFAIATYLRGVIEESRIPEYKTLASIFWHFVLYVFSIFALKTALISLEGRIVNYLILILTFLIGGAVAYSTIKKK